MGAIRLFLAFGVLVAHTDADVLSHIGLRMDPLWALGLIGGRAVLFFYVVSGFLIGYVLHEKYPATGAGTRAFYRSRFLRIYPLWWCLLAVCLFLGSRPGLAGHLPPTVIPAAGLLGSDWLVAFWTYPAQDWLIFPSGAEVGWTLGAELTFYLMAPFVLRSDRTAFALLLVSALMRIVCIWAFKSAGQHVSVTMTYFFFPATLAFFMLGHCAAVIHRRYRIGLALSAVSLTAAAAFSALGNPFSFDDWPFHLSALCFALALPGIFAVTKDNRVCNVLGDLTYPLYLTHSLVISALFWPLALWGGLGEALAEWLPPLVHSKVGVAIILTGVVTVIALSVAWLTHLFVERPARFIVSRILALTSSLFRFAGPAAARAPLIQP